jgi:hypothetical protein
MTTKEQTAHALAHLRGFLGTSFGEVFATATAVAEPGGSTPAWDVVRDKWGVAKLSDEERAQIRAATRPIRGAPVMEVQLVVTAIAQRAREELGALRTPAYHYDLDRSFDQARRALEEGENDVMKAYRTQVLPKRGGMFANATAHVAGAAQPQGAQSAALLCETCGAPQSKPDDFMCKYCGNKMV